MNGRPSRPRRWIVPIAVLLLAGGVFWWTRDEAEPIVDVEEHVHACLENQRQIYQGLRSYRERTGHAPRGSGVAFFGALVAEGIWPATPESARQLTCPGPGAHPLPREVDFSDLAALGPGASAYAGRNVEQHPLQKFPAGGSERTALLACDNARGMNHPGATNVLYSDGSVRTLLLEELIARGELPAGSTTIPIGPSSPVEDLRVLAPEPLD